MKTQSSAALSAIMMLCAACLDSVGSEHASQLLAGDESDSDEIAEGSGGRDGEGGDAGEDDGSDEDACECSGEADLPYNVNLPLGATFQLTDAFLQEGPLPAAVLELTMESPEWRLTELLANTAYVVTQADCDHEGNHGTGRDRANITWQNADGSTESDHFTIRYCEDEGEPDQDADVPCDCGGAGGAGEGGSSSPSAGGGTPGCDAPCASADDCGAQACVDGCCAAVPQ